MGIKSMIGTFANKPPEVHAIVIGMGCGLLTVVTGEISHAVVMWATLTGGRKLKGHLSDARKEFAYAIGGFMFIYMSEYTVTEVLM